MITLSPLLRLACAAALLLAAPVILRAEPPASGSTVTPIGGGKAEYKVISGYKQPFDDALQYHLSKGWTPVGGVSVTSWNGDLFFAQLIGRTGGK